MKPSDLHGTWRVMEHMLSGPENDEFKNILETFDQYCLKGTELEINQNRHMSWNGHSNAEMHPYLKAKSFNLVNVFETFFIWMYIGKGSLKVEFEISLEGDLMILHHKNGIIFEMQRISERTSDEKSFSLYAALDDEDFKDFEIVAESGKYYSCHKCILSSVFKDENWVDGVNFLSGANDDVIKATLHFCYCGCLPSWLDSNGAHKLLKVLQGTTVSPSNIVTTVEAYLHCLSCKDLLQGITQDIESCFTGISHLVSGFESALAIYATSSSTEEVDRLINYGKQILQEAILGVFLLLLWCKTYTERRDILTVTMKKEACQKLMESCSNFCAKIKGMNHLLAQNAAKLSTDSFFRVSEALFPEFEKLLEAAPDLYNCWTGAVTGVFDDLIEANEQEKVKQEGPKFLWGIYNTMVFNDMAQLYNLKEGLDCKVDDAFAILEHARHSDYTKKMETLSGLLKAAIKIPVFDITFDTNDKKDEKNIFKLSHVASRALLDLFPVTLESHSKRGVILIMNETLEVQTKAAQVFLAALSDSQNLILFTLETKELKPDEDRYSN